MLKWILLLPILALCVAINIIIGCYLAIRFGYGPPDWKTALNLVVRVTTLQDHFNAGRDWLGKKAPWADKLLDRLPIPKPLMIVDTPEEEEKGEEVETDQNGEPAGEGVKGTADAATEEQPSAEQPSAEQPSAEQPSTEQPSTEQPSTEQPPAGQPSTGQPPAGQTTVAGPA